MDSALAYEKNARTFLSVRDKSNVGYKVVRDWAKSLPNGAEVLEIACGGGYPITTELEQAGLDLWAMDSSETLLSEFRLRFPNILTKCERVQESNFFGRKFDAVVAIGLIFLLHESDQEEFIKKVSDVLLPNGRFLFTAPTEKGKWKDLNTGLECHSLGLEQYTGLLAKYGFRIVSTIVDKGGNNHYDAEKIY